MKKPVRAAWPTAVLLAARRLGVRLRHRYRRAAGQPDAGMSTAEYAIGTVAACAFAAALYKVVTSGPILHSMQSVIQKALKVAF